MSLSPADTPASLLHRLREDGDVLAWEEIMAVYGPLVLRMALRQGLQQADAEDIVQEVFSAVYNSIEKWLHQPERPRFRRWLLGICRNLSLNAINRKPRGGIGKGGSSGIEELAQISDSPDKLASEFDVEFRRQVYQWAAHRVRQEVSETTWLAFHHSHLEGKSIETVATLLGITASNIYVSRSRVMKRLREMVKKFIESENNDEW